jgi:hypothetical protein
MDDKTNSEAGTLHLSAGDNPLVWIDCEVSAFQDQPTGST